MDALFDGTPVLVAASLGRQNSGDCAWKAETKIYGLIGAKLLRRAFGDDEAHAVGHLDVRRFAERFAAQRCVVFADLTLTLIRRLDSEIDHDAGHADQTSRYVGTRPRFDLRDDLAAAVVCGQSYGVNVKVCGFISGREIAVVVRR